MTSFDSIGQEDLDRVRTLALRVADHALEYPGFAVELAEAAAGLVADVEAAREASRAATADQVATMRDARPDRPMTLEEIEAAHVRRLYEQASDPDPWLEQAPEYQGSVAAHIARVHEVLRPAWLITDGHYSSCCGAPVITEEGVRMCRHCGNRIEHTDPNG
jgi:hypothetical protein